ncbi:MAG: DUF4352 domain-containing protein [Actinomycetales bacterium]|nr:DUF4352 domain-containing protein [Actinomycetales bacterium]
MATPPEKSGNEGSLTAREAKARAKAAKAEAKALRPWYRKPWAILLFLIAGTVIIVKSSGGSDSSGASDSASNGTSASKPAQANMGDTVRDGKFEFKVNTVKCGIESVGSDFTVAKPQGEFCKISITVTNIGNEAQMLLSSNQKMLDAAGREFEASSGDVFMADDSTRALFLSNINPGNSVTGPVYFDVPPGTAPDKIELHDSAFSDGTSVSLK